MSPKTLLVVERNAVGVQMLRAARAAGVGTVLLTRDAGAVRLTDDVRALCDAVVLAETNDLEQATEAALRYAADHPLDAVYPGHEYQVPLAAEIARRLGLVGHAPETVTRVRDKLAMKAALRAAGVPTPRPGVEAGFPLVVKPRDGGGSKNVIRVDDEKALVAARERCRSARRFPLTDRLLSGEALVEELVEGPEVSVECVSLDGRHHVLAVTDKLVGAPPHFVELGHVVPSGLDPAVTERVRALVHAALDAVGLRDGPSHTELRIPSSGEPRVIEVAGRAGGDDIPRLLTLATGNDILRSTLDVLLERRLSLLNEPRGVAAIRFLVPEGGGRIVRATLPSTTSPAIVELRLLKHEGDVVAAQGDNYDRVACAVAFSPDREEALAAAADALAGVVIELAPAGR